MGLVMLLLVSAYMSLTVGFTQSINLNQIQSLVATHQITGDVELVFLTQRIPRMINAIIVGACLAIAGILAQNLTNNPLASPNVLAINSGATLVVLLSMVIVPSSSSRFIFALIGAYLGLIATIGIANLVSSKKQISILVIVGISISILLSSITNLIIYLNAQLGAEMSIWTIGSFEGRYLAVLKANWWLFPIAIICLICLMKYLQVLSLGPEKAVSLGVNVSLVRFFTSVLIAFFSAIAIAIGGPISAVGLIVPHIARRITTGKIGLTLLFGGIIGSTFMLQADVIARLVAYPNEVPVGIITQLIAVGFFVYVAVRGEV